MPESFTISPRPGGRALPRLAPVAAALAALAALGGYVATFAVAANGCWLDVAAAAAASATVAWLGLTCALSLAPAPGGRRPVARFDACAAAAASGGAVLAVAALLNLLVFQVTGRDTLNAHLAALLFLPIHSGLLFLADAAAAAAFLASARRGNVAVRPALLWWLIVFNGLWVGTFHLLGRVRVQ